jgi:hypothetical protein
MSAATGRVVRLRALFCVVEHEHRDLGLAAAVVRGRFTHVGVTADLGSDPDWLAEDLPPDEEWRIDWWKFGYGLDLAYAFAATDDVVYIRAWERLVDSFVHRVPVGSDATEVAARRVLNWIYAWSAFAAAPGFEPGFGDRLLERIAAETARIREYLTPERNHRTLELYALFVAALALPELDPEGDLLAFATAELHRNLVTDFRADGVHREASTHYHLVVLRSLVGVRENARRFAVSLPTGFDALLERACEFALHCQRPDGAIPALSDSDTGRYGDLLELAGELLGREDFVWAGSGGQRGSPPVVQSASFESGGYFFQRSGWGEGAIAFRDERFLVLDCGPLGDGGHGHYDLLSVEVAAGGRPLVVDPGRYTYAESKPNLRRWFKGTAAHSTVCVDGLDQTLYRRGKPRGPTAEGRLLARLAAPGLDVIVAQAVSPAHDAAHTRRVIFVAGEYWLVVDRLEAGRPHRYDLRWQLAPEADGKVSVTGRTVWAPGVALVFASPLAPALEDGWVAPSYGSKLPAPAVVGTVEGAAEAVLTTLVSPLADGEEAPQLRITTSGEAAVAEVSAGERVDLVGWSRTRRAAAAWVRLVNGEPVAARMIGGERRP